MPSAHQDPSLAVVVTSERECNAGERSAGHVSVEGAMSRKGRDMEAHGGLWLLVSREEQRKKRDQEGCLAAKVTLFGSSYLHLG